MTQNEELFVFAEADREKEVKEHDKYWKILIVDDEMAVHEQTKRVLDEFVFEERGLEFISAYSAAEAREILASDEDIPLVLLDVVMETDDAGLELVKYVREHLHNQLIRIILRTGQPGQAPEKKIIVDYDINDYKSKTELTVTKLYTTIISALRAYKLLLSTEHNKSGLEDVIGSINDMFKVRSMPGFSEGILEQLSSLIYCGKDYAKDCCKVNGFTARYHEGRYRILTGIADFNDDGYMSGVKRLPPDIISLLDRALSEKNSFFDDDYYVAFMETSKGSTNRFVLVDNCRKLTEINKHLISIFVSNMSVAFDNIFLNYRIIDNQKEMIAMQRGLLLRLNDVIGLRSKETAEHVNRVAEYSKLLAQRVGLDREEVEFLYITSPMHDVGKVGIPDAILLKPGKLTYDEFEIIKTHAAIGRKMLYDEKSMLLKIASQIAGTHHEKWDGSGYPDGLKEEEIPIYGRITALCDVFDALTTKRPYKEAWTMDKAVGIIEEGRGTHFDPQLVDIFMDNLDEIKEILEREY